MGSERASTILTIDDEDAVRWSIRAYLEDCDYDVLEAENGRMGVELFEREQPDVVLADLRMPEMDGLEVLAHVIKLSPRTPVIIVSGTGIIDDAIEAIRLGAWDYVLKPIRDMAVLGHTIDKALERARLRRENEEYQEHLEESLRALRENQEAARRVQMGLLPPATRTAGPYSLSRVVIPSTYLSGDFVDYFDVNDDHLAFYTADVSGHGASSALVTVLVRSLIRKHLERYCHQAGDIILQPGPLLEKLNAEFMQENLEKHVTMFYGVLRIPDNTLAFANGGQFPVPFLWHNGRVDRIRENGTAVGLFPYVNYTTIERPLPEEFFIGIFSDGVLDALPHGNLEQKQAFLQTLGSKGRIDRFISDLRTNSTLPDDVTVLTIGKGHMYE